jgi:AcrR family transcriptional regulator
MSIGEALFGERGYHGVSIKLVVERAGLSAGSFYNYFHSKEAFYEELLDHTERLAIQEARRVIARMQSPINQLKSLYRFITLGLRRSPLLRGVLAGDSRYTFPGSARRRSRGVLLDGIGEVIDTILATGVRRRMFRTGRFSDVRRLLIVLYTALLVDFERAGNEALTEDVLTLLERGLTRRRPLRRAARRDRRLERQDRDDE